jgi:hypothetical protein
MRSSEMFLELRLLRYRAKGRNEQNVVGVIINNTSIFKGKPFRRYRTNPTRLFLTKKSFF